MRPATTGKGLVFAGGAPRSGLTLLRAVLSAHPHVFCGPDAGILPSFPLQWREFSSRLGELHEKHFSLGPDIVRENFAVTIWKLLAEAPAASQKHLVVEKTPLNVLAFQDLAILFPEAKFIHVVRDGRDVVASLLQRDWRDPRTGALFPHVTDAAAAATYWSGLTNIGHSAAQAINDPQRFYVLNYEALAQTPKRTMRALFDFLAEPFDDRVTRFYENEIPLVGIEQESRLRLRRPLDDDRVGRWRTDLTPAQLKIVEETVGDMLSAFDYRMN